MLKIKTTKTNYIKPKDNNNINFFKFFGTLFVNSIQGIGENIVHELTHKETQSEKKYRTKQADLANENYKVQHDSNGFVDIEKTRKEYTDFYNKHKYAKDGMLSPDKLITLLIEGNKKRDDHDVINGQYRGTQYKDATEAEIIRTIKTTEYKG